MAKAWVTEHEVKGRQPRLTVNVGTSCGSSAASFARGKEARHHTTNMVRVYGQVGRLLRRQACTSSQRCLACALQSGTPCFRLYVMNSTDV